MKKIVKNNTKKEHSIKKVVKKVSFKNFREDNPYSEISINDDGLIKITKPWGDDSIQIIFPNNETDFIKKINDLILPKPFSAIYHKKKKELEIIYTIFKSEEYGKKFNFKFNNKDYLCEFNDSSEILIKLSSFLNLGGGSQQASTNYRNLIEFQIYHEYLKRKDEVGGKETFKPISFFIKNIEWNEKEIINMVKHLNFYMRYFNPYMPIVIFHEEIEEKTKSQEEKEEKKLSNFPKEINGHKLNPYLLQLWEAALLNTNKFLKFLYYYQIIEYASIYYLKDDISQKIQNVLMSPQDEVSAKNSSEKIVEIILGEKVYDTEKCRNIIKQFVDDEQLWNIFKELKDNFTKEISFDNGLKIKPIYNNSVDYESFKTDWHMKIPNVLRDIRNALSHSGDIFVSSNIPPTKNNQNKLKPFLEIIMSITSQIIMHKPNYK